MQLHKGETLFRQGDEGPLFHLKSGLLKIVRTHEDGSVHLMNIIVPGEMIPHHSLITPGAYHGTAVALIASEVETLSAAEWYRSLEDDAAKCRTVALQLQEKLRMMQKRIDQLTATTPAEKLRLFQLWFQDYISPFSLTEVLTQDEIGQFIGLRRETVNRLLRAQASET
ncbi:Crp/Fnr family transcriptional regulator [Cohnella zeiphila]|uniref:Crp/Fnr family transcriptional regulator n=1 Tax=Cohnella zeiphila TaxID=2761120 RepID=A0A7X0VX40_9BACL|nr:Crp/Fnr family transcriptional regulator [Cohnella zeiphila]MBB6733165.1 Crp/Fnr family transcriptional regulator [Cohnella zeiphila]